MKYAFAAFVLGAIYSVQWPENSTTFTRDQILLIYIIIGSVAAVGATFGWLARRVMNPQPPTTVRVMTAVRELEDDKPEGMSGYEIGREMGDLIGHGTLYRALARLEHDGVLTSRWSDEEPRRRLYRRVVP